MDNLADKIIKANEQEVVEKQAGDQAPEGYYTDDMGYWVEQDIRKHKEKFAKYVFYRCIRLNKHLYYDPIEMKMYNRHDELEATPRCIVGLAKLADMITIAQAVWVYDKLKETVPRLDRNRVLVAPGLAWNFEKSELEELEDGTYTTVGGENDT